MNVTNLAPSTAWRIEANSFLGAGALIGIERLSFTLIDETNNIAYPASFLGAGRVSPHFGFGFWNDATTRFTTEQPCTADQFSGRATLRIEALAMGLGAANVRITFPRRTTHRAAVYMDGSVAGADLIIGQFHGRVTILSSSGIPLNEPPPEKVSISQKSNPRQRASARQRRR